MTVVSKYTQTSVDDSLADSGIVSLSRSPSISSVECNTYFVSRLSKVERNVPKSRDPVIIERRNLVNISKLIVKELLDTSTKYGRMLDSDHMTLQHFFIVLEHVLRHGLRPKKGLLGPKKELWDILQLVEKLTPEANDITSSVRNLPTVKTHMGRARAWLRVALMQKKLADYLKVLVDHKDDVLVDYFEPDALMMSEEAIVIIGLLVGLNVIDCNLCVKEEDLDCELGVIDFSLYLRSNHYNNNNNNNNGSPNSADSEFENMTTVLDQKNYIEELNRHLNATVANLQSKVEELTTSNALMKEDLDISRENILALMQENAFLKARQCTIQNWQRLNGEDKLSVNNAEDKDSTVTNDDDDTDVEQLKQQLMAEAKLRREAEKQLNIQVCIKAEMEVAMKFLEKDIHEKQDIIVSLRKQLEDIKIINLEMYKKLQECEEELTQKAEVVSRLQSKTLQIGQMLNNLQKFNYIAKEPTNNDNGSSFMRAKNVSASINGSGSSSSSNAERNPENNDRVKRNSAQGIEMSNAEWERIKCKSFTNGVETSKTRNAMKTTRPMQIPQINETQAKRTIDLNDGSKANSIREEEVKSSRSNGVVDGSNERQADDENKTSSNQVCDDGISVADDNDFNEHRLTNDVDIRNKAEIEMTDELSFGTVSEGIAKESRIIAEQMSHDQSANNLQIASCEREIPTRENEQDNSSQMEIVVAGTNDILDIKDDKQVDDDTVEQRAELIEQ